MFNNDTVLQAIDHLELNQPEEFFPGMFVNAFGEVLTWRNVRTCISRLTAETGRKYKTKLNQDKTVLTVVRIR